MDLLVVGDAVFPTAKPDADPFEGQGTNRGIVLVTSFAEHAVAGIGPGGLPDGALGEPLVELRITEVRRTAIRNHTRPAQDHSAKRIRRRNKSF